MNSLKEQFLLDPEITFLNHGSFGACPRPVFEAYQNWQRELERQPVAFLGRAAEELLAEARRKLAEFLHVESNSLVYFPNPTTAMNMVARSLDLQPGDEILATDHEYGAMDRTWRFICRRSGAVYRQVKIPLPLADPDQVVEAVWNQVNERTRAVFISHITSPTALIFPVEAICRRARDAGILSLIDGAHAPGQMPLHIQQLGADIYTGACHKWLMAPKGSAFLYARPEILEMLQPLIVSWGYEAIHPGPSRFIDYHEWQGTRDPAAYLATPAAIEFHREHDWPAVQEACRSLAIATRRQINELTGLEPVCPEEYPVPPYRWFQQMFTARLPGRIPAEILKTRLYEEYRIEAPIISWNEEILIRVSFQGYNEPADAARLLEALDRIFNHGE